MTTEARFHGSCTECGGHITPGDLIAPMEPEGWAHAACLVEQPAEQVCQRCWLTKPCGCDDE